MEVSCSHQLLVQKQTTTSLPKKLKAPSEAAVEDGLGGDPLQAEGYFHLPAGIGLGEFDKQGEGNYTTNIVGEKDLS